jgi:hypothetical protein
MLMTLEMSTKTKFTNIPAPALFIFANPHAVGTWADNIPTRLCEPHAKPTPPP